MKSFRRVALAVAVLCCVLAAQERGPHGRPPHSPPAAPASAHTDSLTSAQTTKAQPTSAPAPEKVEPIPQEGKDLLIEEGAEPAAEAAKPVTAAAAPPSDTVTAKPSTVDSGLVATKGAGVAASPAGRTPAPEDSLVEEPSGPRTTERAAAAAPVPAADTAKPPTKPSIGPATIEKPRSINFAENLKDYRSPKLAMLLSLVVPGAGQAYVKKYWLTGIFLAAEAAVAGASLWQVAKGKNKHAEALRFADANYDTTKFRRFYNALVAGLRSRDTTTADSVLAELYGQSPAALESLGRAEFYSEIRYEGIYIEGWKDCQPFVDPANYDKYITAIQANDSGSTFYTSGDTTFATASAGTFGVPYKFEISYPGHPFSGEKKWGFSAAWEKYTSILQQEDKYYRTAGDILYLLLVNHIVSAIDAGIMAKAYNDELLGKQSFWQHIGLDEKWVSTSSGPIPGYAVRVMF